MKQCKECGKDFEPKHTKGVFCSSVCKQRNYRKSVAAKLKLLKSLTSGKKKTQPEFPKDIIDNKEIGILSTDGSVKPLMPDFKFATLLNMAKNGVDDKEEFKKLVSKAKLPPNQRDLILSKLKP